MKRITMAHGAGGTVMADLVKKYVLKHLGGSTAEVPLEALDDSAVINDIVLKSDSHAVKPSSSLAATLEDWPSRAPSTT